ncbi:MAG: transcriptional regulator [Deltaproteobacteria bacterium]
MSAPLRDRFVELAPPGHRDALCQIADLEVVLETLLANAKQAWPDLSLDDDVFLAHVAARLPAEDDLRRALLGLHAEDLYLACAAMQGDPAALEAVDGRVLPSVVPALSKIDAPKVVKEEAIDRLRHLVLFGDERRPPKLTKYSGRGALKSWLSVSAVRDLLTTLRDTREVPVDEDALLRRGTFEDDPLLSELKAEYREAFQAAFKSALGRLSSRDRVLLRHYYVDQVGSDALARLHRVHRVTITRWLGRIRETLLEETRYDLRERLEVEANELDSVMRLIGSQLHVSLGGLLGGEDEPG